MILKESCIQLNVVSSIITDLPVESIAGIDQDIDDTFD
jgi:hypothetical protein